MRRISVSTWSLHRTLGRPPGYGPGQSIPPRPSDGLPLLDLPSKLAAFGIHTLEICHFHLASREPAYLAEMRAALDASGIELWSLLVDGGDITDPEQGRRDEAWIAGWLEVAAALGAKNARVIAGKADPSPAATARSIAGLRVLAHTAQTQGVRLMTENWLGLMDSPGQVLTVLDALGGDLGLCADFGNWRGAGKYDDLALIMDRAESCHAKCHFDANGVMDRDDFVRCLDLSAAADFEGPYTLIYDGPDPDEWRHLEMERQVVQPYLG